jgi:lipopolysaccharide transport system permease protein
MLGTLSELVETKDLIWSWTGRTIRARYQQSVLGGLWMIVQPVANVAVFTIIFTVFVPIDTGDIPYIVFSYVAMIPWMFFANSLTDMTISIVANMHLVTKIYFPREILPISAVLARLADFAIAAALLVLLIVIFRLPLYPPGLLLLPVILAIQLAQIVGLGLILAAANVFYRDIQPLLTLGIQLWFYASPIIYPLSLVPEELQPYYLLNPMAGILEAYRAVLLYETLPGPSLVYAGLVSLVVFLAGLWFFKRVEFQFADIV